MVKIVVPTALILLWLAVPAAASTQTTNLGCGAGKLVLNVRYGVQNDLDTGTRGNNWAFDSYARAVHVWRKAPGRFCAASTYGGEFTTIAGPSPRDSSCRCEQPSTPLKRLLISRPKPPITWRPTS